MRDTKKATRQNSLNQTNKNSALFVTTGISETAKFKYILGLSLNKYISNSLTAIRNTCRKIVGRSKLRTNHIDFSAIKQDSSIWIIESFIEGATINFVVWVLFGLKFNLLTIFAWGVGMKQVLSFYWRLRKDGSNTKIFTENK